MNKISVFVFVAILFGVAIFAFAPGQWTPAWVVNHDKFIHLMVFFILSFGLSGVFPRLKLYLHFSYLTFIAILIELIQYLLANRGFSVEDIAYDLIGVMLFYLLVFSVKISVRVKSK